MLIKFILALAKIHEHTDKGYNIETRRENLVSIFESVLRKVYW